MGDLRRTSDRADPMRELSQAIARGTSQVLQRSVRRDARGSDQAHEGGQRGAGDQNCDEIDLRARCETCGKLLPERSPTGKMTRNDRKYCSTKCYSQSWIRLEKADREADKVGRKCKVCGGDIPPSRNLRSKFCSKKCCAENVRMNRYSVERVCIECGKPFKAMRGRDTRYCSQSCASKRNYALGKIAPPWQSTLTPARFDATWR